MTEVERLETFTVMSGLAPRSVNAIRPDSPLIGDAHATNMATMLIRQKAGHKADSIAHDLRNLSGIRSYEP